MFLEKNNIKLSGGLEDYKAKVSMKDLGLPEPTSKFFKTTGGTNLRVPTAYGICFAEDCPPDTKLNKAYGKDQGLVIFGDIHFDFPMNHYVDLYKDIYDSNDLDYVRKKVAFYCVQYGNNLYEVSRWSNKDTLHKDLQLGVLMFTDALNWLWTHL